MPIFGSPSCHREGKSHRWRQHRLLSLLYSATSWISGFFPSWQMAHVVFSLWLHSAGGFFSLIMSHRFFHTRLCKKYLAMVGDDSSREARSLQLTCSRILSVTRSRPGFENRTSKSLIKYELLIFITQKVHAHLCSNVQYMPQHYGFKYVYSLNNLKFTKYDLLSTRSSAFLGCFTVFVPDWSLKIGLSTSSNRPFLLVYLFKG